MPIIAIETGASGQSRRQSRYSKGLAWSDHSGAWKVATATFEVHFQEPVTAEFPEGEKREAVSPGINCGLTPCEGMRCPKTWPKRRLAQRARHLVWAFHPEHIGPFAAVVSVAGDQSIEIHRREREGGRRFILWRVDLLVPPGKRVLFRATFRTPGDRGQPCMELLRMIP
jgi:hypothetical protein